MAQARARNLLNGAMDKHLPGLTSPREEQEDAT